MATKRMTANPTKPARYRPGKVVAEAESSDDSGTDSAAEAPQITSAPPKATSYQKSNTAQITSSLGKVGLEERRRRAAAQAAAQLEAEKAARAAAEEGFVTEEEEEEEDEDKDGSLDDRGRRKSPRASTAGSSSESEGSGSEESEESETSSEDEEPRKLLRPTFIKKDQRKDSGVATETQNAEARFAEEEARRKAQADAMIQQQLEAEAAERAAAKKEWDEDELAEDEGEEVDDTDDINPEVERAAWKLRELKRVKRDRDAIEVAEKEREEIERRRNLTREDREAEDREFLDQQREDREGKGKMGFMQKYFHKGAFFQDDEAAATIGQRDIMGSRYADDVVNREVLPEYMQIRDMAKLGRKGRTRYRDLKTEDTGRYGQDILSARGPPRHPIGGVPGDDRFAPDSDRRSGPTASGANTTTVGQRRMYPGDKGIDAEQTMGMTPNRRSSTSPYRSRKRPPSRSLSRSPDRSSSKNAARHGDRA